MEDRLATYRARKAKEKSSLGKSLFPFFRNRSASSEDKQCNYSPRWVGDSGSDIRNAESNETETPVRSDESPSTYSFLGRLAEQSGSELALKVILWCALFGLFVLFGFGTIFLILTLFYIIYANMRGEGEKRPGEKSAYSVFNPNCERIHGTYTAEQFEKEMLYGIGGAVR
ncbi:uncharacterized protein [Diadema antillarum]|uniref:uncharacterized protein n=1 Tax=Diadema antillarum TaxID=105358 RepID=UPI003A87A05B